MAKVKSGAFREIIIDRCLHNRRGYSIIEIMNQCNHGLECRCEPLITATNTIRNDIASIENRWNVTIETIRIGRNVRYRYEDPNFSIFNCPLNEKEIEQLNNAVVVLKRFEGMPSFSWVEELNARLQSSFHLHHTHIVGFDENKQLKGMEFFTPLFECISKKEVIELQYQSYKEDAAKTYIVHPYYLKEYNQRWFLLALNNEYKDVTIFPLDRIKGLTKTSGLFIENDKVNFDYYFKDIIGVSSHKGDLPTTIVLKVCAEQLPYMLTKPLHHTQVLNELLEDGNAIISIKVIPNFELIQQILSFGERVTVLEPKTLREEIKHRIENNVRNYQ